MLLLDRLKALRRNWPSGVILYSTLKSPTSLLVFAFVAAVVVAVFQAMFAGARPLMDGLRWLVAASGGWLGTSISNGVARSLLVEGVWGGVGSVVVFLPQILVLFLFIGILEDSGYLARAALIADRTMSRVGLQGKSFIPLLSS